MIVAQDRRTFERTILQFYKTCIVVLLGAFQIVILPLSPKGETNLINFLCSPLQGMGVTITEMRQFEMHPYCLPFILCSET